VAFACGALLHLGLAASADPIQPADTYVMVVPGQLTYLDFGPDPIPADFFAPGSQPFGGLVMLGGAPLGATPFGSFGMVDTVVARFPDPFDRTAFPPLDQNVPIEIIALDLKSVQPITVQVTGNPDQHWYFGMMLLPSQVGQGQIQLHQSTLDGGTFQSTIIVQPRFVFVNKEDLDAAGLGLLSPASIRVRSLDPGQVGLGTVDPVPWSFHSPFAPGPPGFFPGVNSPPAPFLLMNRSGTFSLLVILTAPPGTSGAPVPEPATLLSVAFALVGGFALRRRGRKPSALRAPPAPPSPRRRLRAPAWSLRRVLHAEERPRGRWATDPRASPRRG